MLCLRDPADATNDLGRKGVSILHVQTTFQSLVDTIVKEVKENVRPSLMTPLVGDVYARNRQRRDRLFRRGFGIQRRAQAEYAKAAKKIREGEHDTLPELEKDAEEGDIHEFLKASDNEAAAGTYAVRSPISEFKQKNAVKNVSGSDTYAAEKCIKHVHVQTHIRKVGVNAVTEKGPEIDTHAGGTRISYVRVDPHLRKAGRKGTGENKSGRNTHAVKTPAKKSERKDLDNILATYEAPSEPPHDLDAEIRPTNASPTENVSKASES